MRRNDARATEEDRIALVMAEFQLQENQVCRCGADLAAMEHLICPDCGHTLGRHADKYGCEYDRGDRQVQDVGAVAIGPCGCKGSEELQQALAAIRKAKG